MSGIAYYLLQKIIMKGYTGTSALIEALEKQEKKGIISSILYFSSIPLAFVSSALAGGIFIVVAILWLIPDKGIEKALEE